MNYIQTKKFDEVNISVRCFFDLKREDITAHHLLLIMMKAKTEKYPSKQVISNLLSDTYGMRAYYGLTGYGKELMMEHRFQYIHSSLIEEEGYLDQVVEIMDQFLFHSVFSEETLEEAKYLLKNRLIRMEDDPDSIATRIAFDLIEEGTISIPIQGILEDVDKVQLCDIERMYQEYLSKDRHVYICGDIETPVYDYLKSIDSNSSVHVDYAILNTDKTYKKEIVKDVSQTCLAQIYQTGVQVESDEYYPLFVMNSVLGQSPSSLLFKEIREKESLCYSIGCGLIRFDGALIVHTGTFESAVDQVQELIQVQIQRMIDKDIPEENLEIAKMDIIDGLVSGTDSASTMMHQAFLNEVFQRDYDLDGIIERVQKVTLEDISRVAAKLRLVSTGIVKEGQ